MGKQKVVTVKRRKKFVTFFLAETMIIRKINLFFILLWLAVATESRLAKWNDDVEPDAVDYIPVLQEVLEADAPAAQADDVDIDVEAPMKSADVPQGQEADAPAAQADDEDIDVEAPMKSADVPQGQENTEDQDKSIPASFKKSKRSALGAKSKRVKRGARCASAKWWGGKKEIPEHRDELRQCCCEEDEGCALEDLTEINMAPGTAWRWACEFQRADPDCKNGIKFTDIDSLASRSCETHYEERKCELKNVWEKDKERKNC